MTYGEFHGPDTDSHGSFCHPRHQQHQPGSALCCRNIASGPQTTGTRTGVKSRGVTQMITADGDQHSDLLGCPTPTGLTGLSLRQGRSDDLPCEFVILKRHTENVIFWPLNYPLATPPIKRDACLFARQTLTDIKHFLSRTYGCLGSGIRYPPRPYVS
jgi:hypothetical protein